MITRNRDLDYFEADDMLESATFSLQNLKNYYFWILLEQAVFFIWEGKNRVLTKLTLFSLINGSSYTQYFSSFWFLLRKINNTSPHLNFTFIWNNSQLTAVCCRMKAAYVYLQQIGVLSAKVLGALRVFELSSKYFRQ